MGSYDESCPLFRFYNERNESCLRVFNKRFPVSTDYMTVIGGQLGHA